MTQRFAKGLLVLLSVVWMAAAGWLVFGQETGPEVEALRQQRFEQQLNDCLARSSERYECTSALLRKKSSDTANWWAGRLLLIFGPPLAASAAYAVRANLRERRREAARNQARLERREHQAEDSEPEDEDPPLREIDEIRRRADDRRRAAKQPRETLDQEADGPAGGNHRGTQEPPVI